MSSYTISDCLLNNSDNKKYFSDILFWFTNSQNPHKVAVDTNNVIINIYENIAQNNPLIASWLSIMSMLPSTCEYISVNITLTMDNRTIFLEVCNCTVGEKKLIVYSKQNWKGYNFINDSQVHYNGNSILMLDRDEAILDMQAPNMINNIQVHSSIIASGSSSISDSTITQNDKKDY